MTDSPSYFDPVVPEGSIHGSTIPDPARTDVAAAPGGMSAAEQQQLELYARQVVDKGGTEQDLAAMFPQADGNKLGAIRQAFQNEELRRDSNPFDNKPGDQFATAASKGEDRESGGLMRSIGGFFSKLPTMAHTAIKGIQEKLGIGTEHSQIQYAENMGRVSGENVDRMLAQGVALNASLPGRGRQAEIGRA